MKILVTGKNGQVGHALQRSLQQLVQAGAEVVAFDRNGLDLADTAQIRAVVRAVQPNLIINAAAYTAVDLAETETDLAMQINGVAPGILAEEARRCGAALIHYSTDYVYDGTKDGAYIETDPCCPINVYGQTKLAGEQAIAAAGGAWLILRTSWVYGSRGKNFLKTMQRLAAERNELRVVADQYGAPTWCLTIAEATVQAILQLCNPASALATGSGRPADAVAGALSIVPALWQQHGGICHLTARGATSWHGFASAIVARGPRAAEVSVTPITTDDYPVPARRPRNSRLSCQRFEQKFGALPAWEEALSDCLRDEKNA